MTDKPLTIIGRTATVTFVAEGIRDVPVKIDTGADGSSIWASDLNIDDEGFLHFTLFDVGSPYYSGKRHKTKQYSAHLVRSSIGLAQIRYKVTLSVILCGKRIRGTFSLADRSQNTYPVLVGCRLLNKKFYVDVSKRSKIKPPRVPEPMGLLAEELEKNPRAFFEKYHIDNHRGDIDL